MKNQKRVGFFMAWEAAILAVSILVAVAYPIPKEASGLVADVIPNDHGFGLVIESGNLSESETTVYWLHGGGFDVDPRTWKGHLIQFDYVACPLFPRGAVNWLYLPLNGYMVVGIGGGSRL